MNELAKMRPVLKTQESRSIIEVTASSIHPIN